jgi:hypothetical protein
MKEQRRTVTPLPICTDFSYTARRAGMLHVLRGLLMPNSKAEAKVIRPTRFVELVPVGSVAIEQIAKQHRETLIGDRDPLYIITRFKRSGRL